MSEFLIIMQRNRDVEDPRLPARKPGEPALIVTKELIEARQKGFSISARFANKRSDELYAEIVDGQYTASFVLVFGWCYSVTGNSPSLSRADLASILTQHRSETLPLWLNGNRLSGQFCIVSFDHRSQTLWCTCDIWAQHGFYFGADSGLIAASSHAGAIANLLRSQINGSAYVARLRGTAIPPGQTIFANVYRITCGNSLRFDISNQMAWVVKMSEIVKHIESMNFQQSVDHCVDVVSRTCLRAAKLPRLAVDLTGGNDTRISAAVLASRGGSDLTSRLIFKVHETETHPDAIIARRIANEFGWTLRRFDRGCDISPESTDLLLRIAPISDGNRFPTDIAMGILQEEARWFDCDYLWGSLGGELMRDFFWRHEMHLMGLTNKVNYQALLLHRLYASSNVDIERISDARFSVVDHDQYILSAYRSIGEMSPGQKNVYKLDRIYLSKIIFNADYWEYSAQRIKVLPFLTSEVLNVILTIPWVHRVGRRLVKAVVERLQPPLTRIPHDTGAPMAPLTFSNVIDYITFSCRYLYDVYSRHFSGRRQVSEPSAPINTPKQWLMWAIEKGGRPSIGNSQHLLKRTLEGALLSREEAREIEMVLLLRALKEKYPGVIEELHFDHMVMEAVMTNYQL